MEDGIKIALIAGHYLYTPGKRLPKELDAFETREWVLNDRIVDKLENVLAKYNVSILRIDDTTGQKDISLANRTKAIRAFNPDIAFEIHHNAGAKLSNGGGVIVYYNSNQGTSHSMARSLYDSIVAENGLKGNRSVPIKNQTDLYMTNANKGPYFLIENGFMDSRVDAPIILTEEFAEKTVMGILKFLIQNYRIHEVGENDVKEESNDPLYYMYKVKAGDNLSKIANNAHVAMSAIIMANHITNPNKIYVGQQLRIPTPTKKPNFEYTIGDVVKVKPGATWWNGKKISSWVFGTKMYYRGENSNGIMISKNITGAITGTIKSQYLTRV